MRGDCGGCINIPLVRGNFGGCDGIPLCVEVIEVVVLALSLIPLVRGDCCLAKCLSL